MNGLLQKITIYHKVTSGCERYVVDASVRNTTYLNRNKTGLTNADSVLIRIFDTSGYNTTWKCEKGDIIVNMAVRDDITSAPLTELQKKYGKDNVFEVSSIDKYIFDNSFIKKINHIKIGAR